MIGAAATASTKNVFRMFSCSYTMAREYFTILGRVMKLANARDIYQILLKDTNIYQVLILKESVALLNTNFIQTTSGAHQDW